MQVEHVLVVQVVLHVEVGQVVQVVQVVELEVKVVLSRQDWNLFMFYCRHSHI